MKITGVLFDFDHTLGMDHHLEADVLRGLAAKYKSAVSGEKLMRFLESFRAGKSSMRKMLQSVLEAGPIPGLDELCAEFTQDCLSLVGSRVSPMPGAGELFAELQERRIPFAILTNGWKALQEAKASAIRFPGPVMTSEELGHWKPDPEAFRMAAQCLQLPDEAVLYLGDSPEMDVAGAKGAGIPAAWFNPEGKSYPPMLPSPDFILHSLLDLIEIIAE